MNDDLELARKLSMGRIAFGLAMLVCPGFVGRRWIGDDGGRGGVKALIRGFGMRDIALGVATLDAIDEHRPVNRLLQLGVAADSIDAVGMLLAGKSVSGTKKLMVLVIAGGAAATGIRLASNLD